VALVKGPAMLFEKKCTLTQFMHFICSRRLYHHSLERLQQSAAHGVALYHRRFTKTIIAVYRCAMSAEYMYPCRLSTSLLTFSTYKHPSVCLHFPATIPIVSSLRQICISCAVTSLRTFRGACPTKTSAIRKLN
jgi:hypothetical protein